MTVLLFCASTVTSVFGQSSSVGVTEYKVPTANTMVWGIAAGPDGALWFTENNHSQGNAVSKIGRITTSGAFTEYSAPLLLDNGGSNGPTGIAAGPDGALWFTLVQGIGRITPAGVVSEFRVPGGFSAGVTEGTSVIVAGSDGAVWFADQVKFSIGRITPSGSITEYKIPNACSFGPPLRGLVLGPDGAVWFSDLCNFAIGRISTTGVLKEYPVPGLSTGNVVDSIAVGPDGALWFNETDHAIGRITTNGGLTEYPTSVRPGALCTGPDGAIWFSSSDASVLGRISMAGVVTTYDVPRIASQLVLGADGALWSFERQVYASEPWEIVRYQIPARVGVIPHIAAGAKWTTGITLVNNSAEVASVSVNFYQDDGTPLTLPLTTTNGGTSQTATNSSLTAMLNPKATLVISMGDQTSTLSTGWADIVSTAPLGGFAIFAWPQSSGAPTEGTSPLQRQYSSTFTLPFDNTSGYVTGAALTNLSSSGANITATIWDADGNQLGTQHLSLPANGHTSFAMPSTFSLTAGRTGIIQFTSNVSGGLAGLGLRFNPFLTFTSIPAL